MLRVIVDSACSIKQDEIKDYNIDIIPLKILLNNKEYNDGIDLTFDIFYDELINNKQFPKTSLPSLDKVESLVEGYTSNGDDVIILTLSSGISGTYNAMNMLFNDNPHVYVVDSKIAVGGMRFIVELINKNKDLPINEIIDKINDLIPRIVVNAIPETLDYLHRGGRLNKLEFIIGSLLLIKPIIGFVDGKVHVLQKKHGINNSMKYIANTLNESELDLNYGIISSYTYNKDNVLKLESYLDESKKKLIYCYDNLIPSIACHWGPNAFGFIYVKK